MENGVRFLQARGRRSRPRAGAPVSRSGRRALTLILIAAALAGCGGPAKLKPTADPERQGLVYVDLFILMRPGGSAPGPGTPMPLSPDPGDGVAAGAVLVRHGDLMEIRARVLDGRVAVFDNVPPGDYSVVAFTGMREMSRADVLRIYDCDRQGTPCPYAIEADVILSKATRADLKVTVKPGALVYAGTVYYRLQKPPPYGNIRDALSGKYKVDVVTDKDASPRVVNEPRQEFIALGVLYELVEGPWKPKINARFKSMWQNRRAVPDYSQ